MITPALKLFGDMFPMVIQQETQAITIDQGYGVNRKHIVRVLVVCDQCELCGETPYTETYPNGTCKHRWKNRQEVEICVVNGKTPEDAMKNANGAVSKWILRCSERTPEYSLKFLKYLLEFTG